MQMQACISREIENRTPALLQWYRTVKAALFCLEEVLRDLPQVRKSLNTDKRYRSSSCHPLFANPASTLLANAIIDFLTTTQVRWTWDSQLYVCQWAETPASFWVTLAAYHLGDLAFIKVRPATLENVEVCEKLAARQGHTNILEYINDKGPHSQHAGSRLASLREQAGRAGHFDCAKILLSHDSVKGAQRETRMAILHLDSQRKYIGVDRPWWRVLKSRCGKLWPRDKNYISEALEWWADELIRILVIEEGWVPLSASCAIADRISALFWKTVESSFLLLYQHEDGSFSTGSCRELLKKYDVTVTQHLYRTIERHFTMWLTPQLRLNRARRFAKKYRRYIFAAGSKDGLNILAAYRNKPSNVWLLPVYCGHKYIESPDPITMGQLALWYALTKLRPENVEFLLKLDIRVPESTSMELVPWEYRRTREKDYEAVQKLLQEYHTRPMEMGLGKSRRGEILGSVSMCTDFFTLSSGTRYCHAMSRTLS